ncbi:MAG: hypothetical protein AABX82_02875, partial [Nanoarchaeota archaeon]
AEVLNPESCSSCTSIGSDCGKYLYYVLIGLGFLLIYNIAMLWNTGEILETKIDAMEAAAIPLDITMTIITAVDCEDCFSIHTIVAQVVKLNVNVTEQKELASDSEEAKALIEGYQIKTLPAIILGFDPAMAMKVKPDVVKQLEALGFENVDDETDYVPPSTGYLYQTSTPLYYDIETDEVQGLVTIISITTDCEECLELTAMVTALENALTIESVKEVAYGSAEAQAYIEKYDLEAVPSIILSEDAAVYNGFADAWETYGSIEEDGSFVLRNNVPPYLDAVTGEVQGLVDVIYLTDESCIDCYNVTLHKTILRGFGMVLDEETTVDIGTDEGKALLEKYGITKVPTIILSKDAGVYKLLNEVWTEVGEVADDGSYIFTNMKQLQGAKYIDLNPETDTEEADATTSDVADEEASV